MYRKNNVNIEQTNLFSKKNEWTEYKKKRIEKSWAETFRTKIITNIDEDKYKVLYSEKSSRPNTPVNYMVGLLIIKSLLNISDEKLLDVALFDEQVQYALGTLDNAKQPISKNMISNFRVRLYNYEEETGRSLLEETTREINEKLIELTKIDKTLKRVDSMMISSSCKRMARTEIIYKINERFVKRLEKEGIKYNKRYKGYTREGNEIEVLYRIKEEEISGKLTMLLNDSLRLYKIYRNNEKVNKSEEFKQLERIIEEQYDDKEGKPRKGKEIKATSLQTPYDEEATYRYKYGANIGYVGNIVEIVDREKGLILVEDYKVAPNVKSDKEFMEEIIENKKEGEKEIIIVDAGYFSIELNEKAKEANIELHPTDMVGKNDEKETNLDSFQIDTENNIKQCAMGEKPIKSYNRNKKICGEFDKEICGNCKQRNICPVKEYKNNTKIITSKEQIEIAKIRKKRKNKEYKEISKIRSGIEGIPSLLRRTYNIDNRPTKGLVYLGMKISTDILAINIKRINKYDRKIEKIIGKTRDYSSKIIRTIFLYKNIKYM